MLFAFRAFCFDPAFCFGCIHFQIVVAFCGCIQLTFCFGCIPLTFCGWILLAFCRPNAGNAKTCLCMMILLTGSAAILLAGIVVETGVTIIPANNL
jgi:hypothetical protein